jgi:hypothetical protein
LSTAAAAIASTTASAGIRDHCGAGAGECTFFSLLVRRQTARV